MKNLKILIIAGTIIAVAAIATMIYFVAFKMPATTELPANQNNANTQAQPDADEDQIPPQTLKTYTDTINKFAFQYPGNLKSGLEDFTYLPDGKNKQVKIENSLIHEINVEYCAPSGECRPTTQDFGFNIVVINSPFSDVQKSLGGSAEPLIAKQFGSVRALTLSLGVEGEGRSYYFISLPSNKTLMLEQSYIDESVLVGYQKEVEFIKFVDQNKMMGEIIKSLQFLK